MNLKVCREQVIRIGHVKLTIWQKNSWIIWGIYDLVL